MPLTRDNCKFFQRTLYGPGILEKVTLLKRNDDMDASVVTSYLIFDIRWSRTIKSGQPIAGDELSNHYRTIHIPQLELDRVGVHHVNPLDRFVDKEGRTWQAESPQTITIQLLGNHICIECRRCDGINVLGV